MPDVRVEVAFTSGYATPANERTWTDVSSFVELHEGIAITFGRTDERATCDANSLSLTLDNSDGRFTAGLASSPYYPNVKIGRPIRVTAAQVGGPSVSNPTFDVNVSGWTVIGSATFARSTTQAWEGSASGRITLPTAAANAAGVQATMSNLIVGQTYRVALMCFVPTGSPAVGINFGAATTPAASATTTLVNAWQEVELTFTASATTHPLKVFTAGASTAGQFVYLDSVSFASVRFEGYVDAWPIEWLEGVSTYAVARIGASSRMARLGLSNPLISSILQEIGQDSPLALYPLSEPAGATSASDASGNLAPKLNVVGSGPAIVFGSAPGPTIDGLTAAEFRPNGKFLRVDGAALPDTTTACTLEAFALSNLSVAYFSVVNLGNTRDPSVHLELGIDGSLCAFAYVTDSSPAPAPGVMSATGTTVLHGDGETHHLAATVSGTTLRLYVDGILEATVSDADFVFPNVNRLQVGEIYLAGSSDADKTGVVAHVAIYDKALTADRIAAHAGAGLGGLAGDLAVERLDRIAAYGAVPVAERDIDPSATTPMQAIDTSDKTALSLAHMVESTEGGVLFDARDNTFTYVGRLARYGAPAAFTLDMALQQVEAGVRPALDRQGLINDITASTPEGASVRVINQASVDDYGRHAPPDVELLTTDPMQAEAAANWLVNRYGEPRARVPAMTVDVLALPSATQTALLAATVGTRFVVSNWPAQVGGTYDFGFFVEGYTEAIDPESHVIALNVSPAAITDVFILDDAVRGALDGPYPLAY